MTVKTKQNHTKEQASVLRFSHDGRGIAYHNDKIIFLQGALPGEEVSFRYTKRRSQYNEGEVLDVLTPSAHRVSPECDYFGVCGGCALQYLSLDQQVLMKQTQVENQLVQALDPSVVNKKRPPIQASGWHYRRRARLSVKYVLKKDKVLVGFRERQGRYVAEISTCKILAAPVAQLLEPLSQLIHTLSVFQRVPQIEIAVADNATALVLRHLDPLTAEDQKCLITFSEKHSVYFYTQAKGPETATLLAPSSAPPLFYEMHKNTHPLRLNFEPTDFVQINAAVNERLIQDALSFLQLTTQDRVLDLFCGLGNLSLSLAPYCASVTGVEGEAALIERAKANALANGRAVDFYVADLNEVFEQCLWYQQDYTLLILDPPRVGALSAITQLAKKRFAKVLYISCNPATLARDAALLQQQGYSLLHWGIADMFPHTHHVEVIALFVRHV